MTLLFQYLQAEANLFKSSSNQFLFQIFRITRTTFLWLNIYTRRLTLCPPNLFLCTISHPNFGRFLLLQFQVEENKFQDSPIQELVAHLDDLCIYQLLSVVITSLSISPTKRRVQQCNVLPIQDPHGQMRSLWCAKKKNNEKHYHLKLMILRILLVKSFKARC